MAFKLGEPRRIDAFVDIFVERVNDSNVLHASDVTRHTQHVIGDGTDPDMERHVRRDHSADLYVGVREFACGIEERSGEGSMRDSEGTRARQKHVWADAICHARIDLISGATLRRLSSFYVRGDGASQRVQTLTGDERDSALAEAIRRAGAAAAEQITPRRVRESVQLEVDAPDFDRAYALIEAQRLAEARALWEAALKKYPSSAALHFNLALLSEAVGDIPAAQKHFAQARRLSPATDRYRRANDTFQRRMRKSAAVKR